MFVILDAATGERLATEGAFQTFAAAMMAASWWRYETGMAYVVAKDMGDGVYRYLEVAYAVME